jgi:outer membrane protein assembly factor BamB
MNRYFLPCILLSSLALADDVSFLTVTSTNRTNVIEFMNPPSGDYVVTRVVGRADRYPADAEDFGLPLFGVDVLGVQGQKSSVPHAELTNGQPYYYGVFVYDGRNWSPGVRIQASPLDTVNTPIRWRFVTRAGATTMSPPGLGQILLVVSNDGTLYPLDRGPDGGRWAATALPQSLAGVAYHRPPVIPATGSFPDNAITLVTTQDGVVHCFDATTGSHLWDSPDLGMVTGAPAGWFSVFSQGPDDRVYVGTRNVGAANKFYALDLADGQEVWFVMDPPIGIISSGASIDYQKQAAYFASHGYNAGADTVFAVSLIDGQMLWSTPAGDVSGSPVQRGQTLFVGNDDGLVYAFDVADGKVKANFPFDVGTGSPIKGFIFPSFTGPEVYLSSKDEVFRIRDRGTDVVLDWAADVPGASIPTHPPGRGRVWAGSNDGSLYQIDALTGAKTVLPLSAGAGVGNPTFDVGFELIYVGTENGEVIAVQAPY